MFGIDSIACCWIGCAHLTMFIDVQAKALFWLVAAREDDFNDCAIDDGTVLDYTAAYFTLHETVKSSQRSTPRARLNGAAMILRPAASSQKLDDQRGLVCPNCGCRHFWVVYTRAS